MRSFRIRLSWRALFLLLALTLAGLGAYLLLNLPLRAQDWQEWPVYNAEQPETALLEPTGRDLLWNPPVPDTACRLFVSNHPESLGWVEAKQDREGKLWSEEAEGESVAYRVFICHQNWYKQPIYIGLIIENLSPGVALAVEGSKVTTLVETARDRRENWHRQTSVGLRNAYAELADAGYTEIRKTVIPGGKRGERLLIAWKMAPGATLGARLRLTASAADGQGKARFRLSTAWARQEAGLTSGLALIPRGEHHPRGSWQAAGVTLDNRDDPFDLAWDDKDGRAVRCLRLSQPVYADGKKVGYRGDVIYTRETSFNPEQSLANNGMYGARIEARLHVKNSSDRPQTVELYLRYPDKRLEGSYIGAATVYDLDAETGQWTPRETRAVNLGRMTFPTPLGEVHEWWWVTRRLAAYQVPPGETLVIPLTLTHDFPAMLPLGILLKKG